jgi:hypothetical protein
MSGTACNINYLQIRESKNSSDKRVSPHGPAEGELPTPQGRVGSSEGNAYSIHAYHAY